MMLTTPRKALAPYTTDMGPRTISICLIDSREIWLSPNELAPVVRNAVSIPSTSTRTDDPLALMSPKTPRMPRSE